MLSVCQCIYLFNYLSIYLNIYLFNKFSFLLFIYFSKIFGNLILFIILSIIYNFVYLYFYSFLFQSKTINLLYSNTQNPTPTKTLWYLICQKKIELVQIMHYILCKFSIILETSDSDPSINENKLFLKHTFQ